MTSPDLLKKLAQQGAVPRKLSTTDFGKLMNAETIKWGDVIRKAKIKGE